MTFERNNNKKVYEIENKIGREPIIKDEIDYLLNESIDGNDYAIFTYGLYLLIEMNDEKAALEWLKTMKEVK